MRWILAFALGGLGIYSVHRVATWAAGRGWIYYRNGPRRGNTVGLIEEVFQPSYEHVLEERAFRAVEAHAKPSGDPEQGG